MTNFLFSLLFIFVGCGDKDESPEVEDVFSGYKWESLEEVPKPAVLETEVATNLIADSCYEPAFARLQIFFNSLQSRILERKPTTLCDGATIESGVTYHQVPAAANNPETLPIESYKVLDDGRVMYKRCDATTKKTSEVIIYKFGDEGESYLVDTIEITYPVEGNKTEARLLIDKGQTTENENRTIFSSKFYNNGNDGTYATFEALKWDLKYDADGFGSSVMKGMNSASELSVEELLFRSKGGRRDFKGGSMTSGEVRYFNELGYRITESEAEEDIVSHSPKLELPTGGDDEFFDLGLTEADFTCEGEVVEISCPGLLQPGVNNPDPFQGGGPSLDCN